jgi:hypothetical protein
MSTKWSTSESTNADPATPTDAERLTKLEADMDSLHVWLPQLFTKTPAKIPVKTWLDEPPTKVKVA